MTGDTNARMLAYNAQTPRYTSYPTAPHFTAADPALHQSLLTGIDRRGLVSLYVHIPFCREMCWYCGCNTSATRKYAPVEDYLALLLREVRLWRDTMGVPLAVSHLHFGGGSPSMLSPDDFRRIMESLRTHFSFAGNAEIAIEVDPRGVTYDKAAAYAECGVNRGSFGIQDYSPVVQAAINRMQPAVMVSRAVDLFRQAGITALNFDVMYGLPLQACDDVAYTIEQSLLLGPQRMAVFGYAHVPWMKKHMRLIRDEDLPDGAERLAQFTVAERALTAAGMQAVGIDHFVAKGDAMWQAVQDKTLSRNFQGYTTDRAETLIGLGASSISRFKSGFSQNAPTVTEYAAAILAGRLPVTKTCPITADDRLRGRIISDLMCYLCCDVGQHAVAAGRNVDVFDAVLSELDDLVRDGLVTRDGRVVTIMPAARQMARVVAARFDGYLSVAAKRHAQVA